MAGHAKSVMFDAATKSLVVLGPGKAGHDVITAMPAKALARAVPLPGPATAMTGDNRGHVYASSRGGYFRAGHRAKAGSPGSRWTARTPPTSPRSRFAPTASSCSAARTARFTLCVPTRAVGAQLKIFARVDALVTQGNTAVVLDRGQTSVTTVDASGAKAEHALRAGEGATTLAADPVGRVLVADTRGDGLLVFGTDPLMLRQRYPVRDAPYGLAGSSRLAWVSQTTSNTVIGYDLATGIPVEKVRYPTVQQPNSLAFDEASGTLYVVSGTGAGVQVIADAGVSR